MSAIEKPILLCCQPASKYYAWQVEVMLNNFLNLSITELFDVHLVFSYDTKDPDHKNKIANIFLLDEGFEKMYGEVFKFFYYEDTRPEPRRYVSSIRPNLLKQHFATFPELKNRTIFYHDCDVIFIKRPDFILNLCQKDKNWYVSDTISYIGHDYIMQKGEEFLNKMCEIVGIEPSLVKSKQVQSGGAQYVLKGADFAFWDKVERDSENLFYEITNMVMEKKQKEPEHHEIQIWCADMWAVLWNAWLLGYNTHILKCLDFCWATESVSKFNNDVYIYHNAGATADRSKEIFFKGEFINEYPYGLGAREYNQNLASSKYYQLVQETGAKTFLITMDKVKEIFMSYAAAINPSEEQKKIAQYREKICLGDETTPKCEFFRAGFVPRCSKCSCPIAAKIYSPKVNGCPMGKWLQ